MPPCLTDTWGATESGAEERGQAEAIARKLEGNGLFKVPIVVAVIGEEGSAEHWPSRGRCHFDAGERLVFGDLARRLRRYLVPPTPPKRRWRPSFKNHLRKI